MKKKQIQLVNGETYSYIDTEQGDNILVLVHGNMSSSIHYKPLIERLKDEYRVIAPDLRGFGDSTYNKRIDDLSDLSEDLKLFLDALQISTADIAGWSTGGAIVLKFAALYPDMVQHIILIESASYRGYPIFKKDENGQPIVGEYYQSREEIAADPVQVAPMVGVMEGKVKPVMKSVWDAVIYTVNKPSKEDDDLYLDETLKQRNLVDIDWCLTTFNMSNFSNGVTLGDNSIKQVQHPVISFWGDQDQVVLEYMIDETIEALPHAKKVVLQQSGHSPLVDVPDQLADEIRSFIE